MKRKRLCVTCLNLIGLAITAIEIIYRVWIMNDPLEDWCERSCLRDKGRFFSAKYPYRHAEDELEELQKVFMAVNVK